MKKIMISAGLLTMFLLNQAAITDGGNSKADGKKGRKKEMAKGKEHVCSADCKEGKHRLAHGEKGHQCTAECHKKM